MDNRSNFSDRRSIKQVLTGKKSIVRERRKEDRKRVEYCKVKKKKEKQVNHTKKSEVEKTLGVKGETCSNTMEWLSKSIVGESLAPVAIEYVAEKLVNEWLLIIKVRDMRAYKTLITFSLKNKWRRY